MAFRVEAAAFAFLMALPAIAQEYSVRNGVLRVTDDSIAFAQKGRWREWKFGDIRQLTLGPTELRVQTYESRNREFVFKPVPRELAVKWYPIFSARLDQRFVAALADARVQPAWQLPAKLARLRGGVQGDLLVSAGCVVFRAALEGESRTWRITDIESVASAGPFDFTLTTREKEFRFDLKQTLPETPYQQLWRAVNRAQGLQILP
jgi:hypothetical protein